MIHNINEKEGKTGSKYFVLETSKGKMSCFPDYAGLKELKMAYAGEQEIEVNVETSEDGKFQNIRNEKKINTEQSQDYPNFKTPKISNGRKEYDKDPVGLVIELLASGWDSAPDAIDAVKQAQKAFS